jgi:uncharacterized membrane protein
MRYRGIVATPTPSRFDRLDALRGAAMVWMAGFHFCFDLNHFGYIHQNLFVDPFWLNQRTVIVSTFLFCAGLGQAIALRHGQGWPRFWRRWAQIAGCALLVTIGSWFMFPASFISFGVLHAMALLLVITRVTTGLRGWLWLLGLLAVALPFVVHHPFFDGRFTNWIGLGTHKPVTEDYVPLLPWLGLMWWGHAAGQWLLARRPGWLQGGVAGALRPLATLGRWSLVFYMIHQPVLIGLLMAVRAAT